MTSKTTVLVYALFAFLLIPFPGRSQVQLVVNEISQGPSGTEEYTELLVVGTPGCAGIPTYDIRHYYVDDNNGTFAAGAGVGIADGCVRLTNDPLWANVPAGTLIVFYNDSPTKNASVPPDDFSTTDGNCILVIPYSNCQYLEKNTTQPNVGNATYPAALAACGSWSTVAMRNAGDSYHTLDPTGAIVHAVSWGNNVMNNIVYLGAGDQTGEVSFMDNSTNNNPALSANWTVGLVSNSLETPGAPNNAANAAWINSMNNSCGVLLPLTTPLTSTNAGCTCSGSATVTPSGSIGPYTYTWSPSGGNSSVASGLCAGNYTCIVNSSNGCVGTVSVAITGSPSMTISVTSSSVACNGASTGSATTTVSGGSSPYTYTWSPTGGNSSNASGLSAGNYTVLVHDAGSCAGTGTVAITQPAAALSATAAVTASVSCNGGTNGSATISASGGTAGYTYSWSPSGGTGTTASGLGAGTYSVLVTDAYGCTSTKTVSITQPASALSATVTSNPATCGSSNASATITASGGTGAYTYSWSPIGGTGTTASGLNSGNYTVSVTDANGCVKLNPLVITNAGGPTATAASNSIACNGSNTGTATVTASGGTGPYTYTWSPSGGNGTSASGLTGGTYTVTVADANSCVSFTTVTIAQPAPLTTTVSTRDVLCFGGSSGSATVSVAGGTTAYSYSWTPGGSTTSTAAGLNAGNYTVLVTDAHNCTTTNTLTIFQPAAPVTATVSVTNIPCSGTSTGAATVNISGNSGATTYSWSPSGGTGSGASGLSAGNYTVLVTDAKGCTGTGTVSVNANPLPTVTVNSSTICPAATATLIASGATTYTWNTGASGSTYTVSPAGNTSYTVTATDNNGCTNSAVASVSIVNNLTVTAAPASNIICNGTSTTITASGAASYTWSPAGSLSSANGTTVTATPTVNTTYTVSGSSGTCFNSYTLSLNVNNLPTVNANANTPSVCQGGTVTLNGTGAQTYTWTGGATNGNPFTPASTQVYTVTGTDINGCINSATISVTVNPDPTITVNSVTMCPTATATLTANGATTYTWNTGVNGSTYTVSPAGNTSYTVTGTDGNGCINTAVSNIAIVNSLTVTAAPANNAICKGSSTTITASGATNYTWSPAGSLSSSTGSTVTATPSVSTTYTISGTSGACANTNTVLVTVNNLPVVNANTTGAAVCSGGNVTLSGSGAQTYTWTGGVTNGTPFTPVSSQTYTVTGTDINGCVNSATIAVTVNPNPTVTVNSPSACSGSTATLSANGALTYSWSTSQSGSGINVNPSSTTQYTVTGLDANGCPGTAIATVNVNPLPNVTATPSSGTICPGSTVTITASGASTYTWNTSQNGNSITVNPASSSVYTVTGTDVNGCVNTNTTSVTLAQGAPSPQSVLGNTVICQGMTGTFSVAPGNYTYTWTGPSGNIGTGSSISLTQAGVYTLTTSNPCGNSVSVFTVTVSSPEASFTQDSVAGQIPFHVIFTNTSTGNNLYNHWNFLNGDTSNQVSPTEVFTTPGTYSVQLIVTDAKGCKDTATYAIQVSDVPTVIIIPNVFSPNGDSINDVFFIRGEGIKDFNCVIYDRWGVLMYEWTGINGGWDGRNISNGKLCSEGTYYYIINYKNNILLGQTKTGYLLLVR